MLSSSTYNGSLMVLDSEDVVADEIVRGNIPRSESLEKISLRYGF
jgi:hypothetical protein